jgi:translation initiation factor IF-3
LKLKKGVNPIAKVNKLKLNEDIPASEVRLISETGEQLGVTNLKEAIEKAKDVGLDLIQIAPNAKPPVAKILNYGKLKYEEKKQAHANKKKQHVVKVKEIRVRPRIDDHDLETKINLGRKFLTQGCKLKVTLMYRGREFFSRKQDGEEVLKKVVEILKDISVVDKPADLQGRRISVILSPK